VKTVSVFQVISFLLIATPALGQGTYSKYSRVQRVALSIEAIKNTKPAQLEDTYKYLSVMKRNKCRSSLERLQVQCLIKKAHRYCTGITKSQRRYCMMYADVITVNQLSESAFITDAQRYLIMKNHRNYRARLRQELNRQYSALATAFVASPQYVCDADNLPCLAEGIDQFCFEYGEGQNLSWQHCVSALVWIIGTSPGDFQS